MAELITVWGPMLVVPVLLAMGVAYLAGTFLRTRLAMVADPLKAVAAGIAPLLAVVGYFWIWQKIDFARHQAEHGDVGHMGPMVALIYGFPVFMILAIASFAFAAYTFYRRK